MTSNSFCLECFAQIINSINVAIPIGLAHIGCFVQHGANLRWFKMTMRKILVTSTILPKRRLEDYQATKWHFQVTSWTLLASTCEHVQHEHVTDNCALSKKINITTMQIWRYKSLEIKRYCSHEMRVLSITRFCMCVYFKFTQTDRHLKWQHLRSLLFPAENEFQKNAVQKQR